jgi:hypothetical protein
MPQSANFSVRNALKLTYKHPEIKKILGSLSLAIKGTKGKGRGGDCREGERRAKGRGMGRDGGRGGTEGPRNAGRRPRPPSFLTDRRPCSRAPVDWTPEDFKWPYSEYNNKGKLQRKYLGPQHLGFSVVNTHFSVTHWNKSEWVRDSIRVDEQLNAAAQSWTRIGFIHGLD